MISVNKNMDEIYSKLKELGISARQTSVYIALLSLGSSSVRKIAEKAGLNRGVTYEALKELQALGLVSFFHTSKQQHFVAEHPEKLIDIIARKEAHYKNLKTDFDRTVQSLAEKIKIADKGPVVTFYENFKGVRTILEDVLSTLQKQKNREYVVYSSSSISPYLYNKKCFPEFTSERIKRKIFVRTIASGPKGAVYGNDERKWLSKKALSPTYKLIYAGKVAMISVGSDGKPHGTIIEDKNLFETERMIFDALWKSL